MEQNFFVQIINKLNWLSSASFIEVKYTLFPVLSNTQSKCWADYVYKNKQKSNTIYNENWGKT